MFESVRHNGEFFFDKESANCGFHKPVFDDCSGGSVRTVRGSESVVYVDFAEFGKRLAERFVSSFFARVKTEVFEKNAFSVFKSGNFRFRVGSDDIFGKSHFAVEKFVESVRNGFKREFFDVFLRFFQRSCFCVRLFRFGKRGDSLLFFLRQSETGSEYIVGFAHMRTKYYLCSMFHKVFNGRKRAVDTVLVGDYPVLHRNVEVTSYKTLFTFYVNVTNRFFVHKSFSFQRVNILPPLRGRLYSTIFFAVSKLFIELFKYFLAKTRFFVLLLSARLAFILLDAAQFEKIDGRTRRKYLILKLKCLSYRYADRSPIALQGGIGV